MAFGSYLLYRFQKYFWSIWVFPYKAEPSISSGGLSWLLGKNWVLTVSGTEVSRGRGRDIETRQRREGELCTYYVEKIVKEKDIQLGLRNLILPFLNVLSFGCPHQEIYWFDYLRVLWGWLTLLLLNTNMLVPDQEKLVTANRGQWDMNAFNLHSNNNLARKTGQNIFIFQNCKLRLMEVKMIFPK